MFTMGSASKRDSWRDPRVALEYEARRFRTPLQRLKHRRDERAVLALLPAGAGARVLDLPCGTGRLFPALRRAGFAVIGGDVSLEMMRAGKTLHEDARAELVQADGMRLPFLSGVFDAVVSLRFLFHLEHEERVQTLRELRRASRGVVIGQVRYRWTLKHFGRYLRSRVGLCARYRPSQDRCAIAGELAQAGLELLELRPISRLFSDKALFLARPVSMGRAAIATEVHLVQVV